MRFPIILEIAKASSFEPITEVSTNGFNITIQVGRLVLEQWFTLVGREK